MCSLSFYAHTYLSISCSNKGGGHLHAHCTAHRFFFFCSEPTSVIIITLPLCISSVFLSLIVAIENHTTTLPLLNRKCCCCLQPFAPSPGSAAKTGTIAVHCADIVGRCSPRLHPTLSLNLRWRMPRSNRIILRRSKSLCDQLCPVSLLYA